MPNEPVRTTHLARGSLWSLSGQAVGIGASLLTLPFLVRMLGAEAFGMLAVINASLGYLAFSDLGMSSASTRFAADRLGVNDRHGEVAVVWTSLVVVFLPAIVAAAAFVMLAPWLVGSIVNVPDNLQRESVLALRLSVLIFLARSVSGVVNTPQLVRLRLDTYNQIQAVAAVGQAGLVLLVLFLGGGLVETVAAMATIAGLATIGQAFYSWRLLPELSRPEVRRDLLTPLLNFGGSILLIVFAGTILFNGEKLLLAMYLPINVLGYYAVAFSLARMLGVLPGALSQSLLPALTRLRAEGADERFRELYSRSFRGLVLWTLPAAVAIWLCAAPLLQIFGGSDLAASALLPLRILLVGVAVDGISYVARTLLESVAKPGVIARCQLLELLPYLLLAAYATRMLGATGAAAIWSLRAIGEAAWLFRKAQLASGTRLFAFPGLRVYGVSTVLLAVPILAIQLHLSSVPFLVAVTTLSFTAFVAFSWRFMLTKEERSWMSHQLQQRFGGNTSEAL